MATVTINITRANIYAIAEGVSITISQHNGGTPTYEQLWASKSEAKKLDIYYREAVSDLERRLMLWLSASSSQFDLTADGDDYTLVLNMSPYWPARLEGLLANKIQDYLVHAVTAGWLNDFAGLEVKQDYVTIAAQDLSDIHEILHQRGYNFTEGERGDDTDEKDVNDGGDASARGEDTDQKDVNDGGDAGERADDPDQKDINDGGEAVERGTDPDEKSINDGGNAGERADDPDKKDINDGGEAGDRKDDTKKDTFVLPKIAGFRQKDDVKKAGPDDKPYLCKPRTDRHHDNAAVQPRTDWTDMSGTGIAYCKEMCPPPPTRPQMGMGYTPAPDHKPCGPYQKPPEGHIPPRPTPPCGGCPQQPIPPEYDPRRDPKVYPEPPYHAKPPKFPPVPPLPEVHANGIGWSDDPQYNEEQEKKFINSHDCGHHDCEDGVFDFTDDNNIIQ